MCAGMPVEITIYLSADHVRAEESCRGIRGVAQQNYGSSDYLSLLTTLTLVPLLFPTQPPPQTIETKSSFLPQKGFVIATISLHIASIHKLAA